MKYLIGIYVLYYLKSNLLLHNCISSCKKTKHMYIEYIYIKGQFKQVNRYICHINRKYMAYIHSHTHTYRYQIPTYLHIWHLLRHMCRIRYIDDDYNKIQSQSIL